ncbi:MAG: hypothetical protein IT422_05035 [Pirellulaceae bacterium]|nr:hypothetical protein [Pirellulaceae bacterium]
MESKHEQFRRVLDGVIGVGFVQTHTGMATAAIAWPDREPSRYLYCDLDGYGVEHILDALHAPEAVERQTEPEQSGQDLGGGEGTTYQGPESESETEAEQPTAEQSEADIIGEYLLEHGLEVTNKSVIDALRAKNVIVQSGQVTAVKEQLRAE